MALADDLRYDCRRPHRPPPFRSARMKSFFRLLLVLAFAGSGAASAQAPQKVASIEGVNEYRLANGLRVLILPDPGIDTVTVHVTYMVGSRHEGYGEKGM